MKKRLLIGAVGLLAGAGALGVWAIQSGWLEDRVRERIVFEAERATGGVVEMRSLHLSWQSLEAVIEGLTIRGLEPRSAAPLLAADRVTVGLQIVSLVARDFRLTKLIAEKPRAHVIVSADGKTNVPHPRVQTSGKASKILDLKIGHTEVRDGGVLIETAEGTRDVLWSLRGDGLSLGVDYAEAAATYTAKLGMEATRLSLPEVGPLNAAVNAEASIDHAGFHVHTASLRTKASEILLDDVEAVGFRAPFVGKYDARLSLPEMRALLISSRRLEGTLRSSGTGRWLSSDDFSIDGTVAGEAVTFDQLRGITFSGGLALKPARLSVQDLKAHLGANTATVSATFSAKQFSVKAIVDRLDLASVASFAGLKPLPYNGILSGPLDVSGPLPEKGLQWAGCVVSAKLDLAPVAGGERVDGHIEARYTPSAGRLELGHSWVEFPNTRADLSGTLGEKLNVRLASRDVNEVVPAIVLLGGDSTGLSYRELDFDGTVEGQLSSSHIAGNATIRNGAWKGQRLESFRGGVALSADSLDVRNASAVWEGFPLSGDAGVGLTHWKLTDASALRGNVKVADSAIPDLFRLAGYQDRDLLGRVHGTAGLSGTFAKPGAAVEFALSNGTVYDQPFDSVTGHLNFAGLAQQSATAVFASGPKRLNITARFEGDAGQPFPAGRLSFMLNSNTMPLNQIALLRGWEPDIRGTGQFQAGGMLMFTRDAAGAMHTDLTSVSLQANAGSVELAGRSLGNAKLTASTQAGLAQWTFDSNAAKSTLHGEGTVRLGGDYPLDSRFRFSNSTLSSVAMLLAKPEQVENAGLEGSAEGEAVIAGPLLRPDAMTARLDLPKLEVRALPGSPAALKLASVTVRNTGPVRMSLSTSQIRIDSARFEGPETDITVDGDMALTKQLPLNLHLQGTVNLALARSFLPDLSATGVLALNTSLRGTWKAPEFSGRATIRNGEFHYADFTNGLSNANGEVLFSGARATIQSLTAESGGGKVEASGFAAVTNGLLSFRVEAKGKDVRVRWPEGVSSVTDSNITLAGTTQRSEASGSVSIRRLAINPKSDAAGMLARATGAPFSEPAAQTGPLANINLDVQIETAPDIALETSVAQSIQANASLRLRGTAASPALLGRVNITQGEVVFFGNKYTISQGVVSFFNPSRIDPVLNVDLATRARGVDVSLTVSGPVNKLNLSYRSDPPLQFADIVALLATGRTPSDPSVAIRDSGSPQSFQQLGASALLGQAIANPVAGRLQRFFGVSRIKIDPQLADITGNPGARLTIEQQVSPDLLFTYITDVSNTSTQLIRVEWAFSRSLSAVLLREENGYVGLDFTWKKRFK